MFQLELKKFHSVFKIERAFFRSAISLTHEWHRKIRFAIFFTPRSVPARIRTNSTLCSNSSELFGHMLFLSLSHTPRSAPTWIQTNLILCSNLSSNSNKFHSVLKFVRAFWRSAISFPYEWCAPARIRTNSTLYLNSSELFGHLLLAWVKSKNRGFSIFLLPEVVPLEFERIPLFTQITSGIYRRLYKSAPNFQHIEVTPQMVFFIGLLGI